VVVVRDGRVLVARRDPEAHQGGKWEFPGGKLRAGESAERAARRELAEETGLLSASLRPLATLVHDYADRPLRFHVFLAAEPRGEVRIEGGRQWSWQRPTDLATLDMPEANRAILRAIRGDIPV